MLTTIESDDQTSDTDALPTKSFHPEVSVVMPCLNEAETLATCIQEAQQALADSGIDGEVVIADNGSTDGSQQIASALGARVINVKEKGYGNALRGGIDASYGRYIVMADSDCSYDFGHTPRFVEKLREGFDLVMGNRFQGGIAVGAMPWKHRYIGNPVLSGIGRLFFNCPASDFHCGLRGFSKAAYERMELNTTGMEFASEMVIKSTLKGMKIAEIPTVLRPDGRSRPPHLRSWRDGWRHLRFMLLYCPRWLFTIPGSLLLGAGAVLMMLIARSGVLWIGGIGLSVNTSLTAAMSVLLGCQLLIGGAFAADLGSRVGAYRRSRLLDRLSRWLSLEYGVIMGLLLIVLGAGLFSSALLSWKQAKFGVLPLELSVGRVIPSVTLIMLGTQTVFGSFFLSLANVIGIGGKRTSPNLEN